MIGRKSLLPFAIVLALPAAAHVHCCADAAGRVSFSDAPCPASAKQSQHVMGAEATSTYDPYAHERTMQNCERAAAISGGSINEDAGSRPIGAALIERGPDGPGGINRQRPKETMDKARPQLDALRRQEAEKAARRAEAAPGQLVNCDPSGCRGANSGVRYNFVAAGNLQGTSASFCARDAGNIYSCNWPSSA